MSKKLLLFINAIIVITFLIPFSMLKVSADQDDQYNPKDLSDYFGNIKNCTYDKSENDCRNGNEYKFYLKMYDIYFLYQKKYNVKIDTSLIMSALFYNDEEPPTVFKRNLNNYNRSQVKNGTTVTNLDWEYDFKNDDCYTYLNANDFSYDMQILAKNMVKKTINYKCVKNDESNEGEKEILEENKTAEDIETSNYSVETLKCENGEYDKDSVSASYKLDLKKYDAFLLEYVKLKYHTEGSEVKSCSSSIEYSNNSSNVVVSKTGKEAIDKMNEIALKAAADGLSNQVIWNWYGASDDWCAMFVSWLFDQVGGLNKYFIKNAAAGPTARDPIAAGMGTWHEDECTDPTTVPMPGDVLHWKAASPGYRVDQYSSKHVGYVYAVDDQNIYTVEGNHDPYRVVTVVHARKDCNINGYYRPNY